MKTFIITILAALGTISAYAEVTGDVNNDGAVTSSDITMLYNYLLNNDDTYLATSDVNGDGNVTSADVTAVYSILLGDSQQIPEYIDFTVNGVTFRMIYVKGGTFTMGNDNNASESPAHSVTLTDFYMAETECTQALWKAIYPEYSYFAEVGDQKPCNGQWYSEILQFVEALNNYLHASGALAANKNFMLPTEAQWEWAARGGVKSEGYTYAGSNNIDAVACYGGREEDWTHAISATPPDSVATKFPNELGLYDMSGNVEEWCQDWYGNYSAEAQINPVGPASGSSRVCRGGSICNVARACRTTKRSSTPTNHGSQYIGLRLVM